MRRLLRWSTILLIASCLTPAIAGEHASPAKWMNLRSDPGVILHMVARNMNIVLRPEIPAPAIFFASATPLKQFQDAIESQWKFRPHIITNAYVAARNEIYLCDDAAYYRRLNRTLDDSLAHELVHFLQAKYLNDDLASDGSELQAVTIQTWFRETTLAQTDPAPQRIRSGYFASGSRAKGVRP